MNTKLVLIILIVSILTARRSLIVTLLLDILYLRSIAGPHGHYPIKCTPVKDDRIAIFRFTQEDVGGREKYIEISKTILQLMSKRVSHKHSLLPATKSIPYLYKGICEEFYSSPYGHQAVKCTPNADFSDVTFRARIDDVGGIENHIRILHAIIDLRKKYQESKHLNSTISN